MKLVKVIAAAAVVAFAAVGVAQAGGVFVGKGKPAGSDAVHRKAERLEQKLEAQASGRGVASASKRGRRGKRGKRGKRGPRGPQGPPGTFGAVRSYSSAPAYLCSYFAGGCSVGTTRVACPPGTVLTGGGYTGAGILTTVTWSASIGNAWAIIAVNFDEAPVTGLRATAECAT